MHKSVVNSKTCTQEKNGTWLSGYNKKNLEATCAFETFFFLSQSNRRFWAKFLSVWIKFLRLLLQRFFLFCFFESAMSMLLQHGHICSIQVFIFIIIWLPWCLIILLWELDEPPPPPPQLTTQMSPFPPSQPPPHVAHWTFCSNYRAYHSIRKKRTRRRSSFMLAIVSVQCHPWSNYKDHLAGDYFSFQTTFSESHSQFPSHYTCT